MTHDTLNDDLDKSPNDISNLEVLENFFKKISTNPLRATNPKDIDILLEFNSRLSEFDAIKKKVVVSDKNFEVLDKLFDCIDLLQLDIGYIRGVYVQKELVEFSLKDIESKIDDLLHLVTSKEYNDITREEIEGFDKSLNKIYKEFFKKCSEGTSINKKLNKCKEEIEFRNNFLKLDERLDILKDQLLNANKDTLSVDKLKEFEINIENIVKSLEENNINDVRFKSKVEACKLKIDSFKKDINNNKTSKDVVLKEGEQKKYANKDISDIKKSLGVLLEDIMGVAVKKGTNLEKEEIKDKIRRYKVILGDFNRITPKNKEFEKYFSICKDEIDKLIAKFESVQRQNKKLKSVIIELSSEYLGKYFNDSFLEKIIKNRLSFLKDVYLR